MSIQTLYVIETEHTKGYRSSFTYENGSIGMKRLCTLHRKLRFALGPIR